MEQPLAPGIAIERRHLAAAAGLAEDRDQVWIAAEVRRYCRAPIRAPR